MRNAHQEPAQDGLLSRFARRWRLRRAIRRELLREPDSVLEDLGVERAAAEREAAKPFWRA